MAFDLSSITRLLTRDVRNSSKRSVCIGVDIGASAIKIVQIRNEKGIPTLDTYGELQLGPYESTDIGRTTHLPQDKLTEALVDIMRESGATCKSAGFALPYNSSFTNVITVPTLDAKEIETMVPVEARKYVPTSLTQVTLDWIPLETIMEENSTKVLLSAIYNDAIKKYEAVVQNAGLVSLASEIEIFSSLRAAVSPKDDAVAILDCGASSTRLYIVEKGVVRKTHSIQMSGVNLTKAIESALKLSFPEAEEMKWRHGLVSTDTDSPLRKVLTKEIERGLRELHTVMIRYEKDEEVAIKKVLLSGGGSLLKGFDMYAQDMFSRPVVLAQPFEKVAYPAFLEDTLKNAGPSFAVAIGVALRTFQNAN